MESPVEENRDDQQTGHLIKPAVMTFITRNIRLIAIFLILGTLAGGGVYTLVPKQWEASGVLQIGQIYSIPTPGLVEPSARTVERLKQLSFVGAVAQKLGWSKDPEVDGRTKLLRTSFQADALRGADLIRLKVRGRSPEEAQKSIDAATATLIENHAVLLQPSVDRLSGDLRDVEAAVALAERRNTYFDAMTRDRAKQAVRGTATDDVLLSELFVRNDTELRALRLQRVVLREQLDPSRTFNTRLMGEIDVSVQPVFPKLVVFLFGGLVIGAVLSLLIPLVLDVNRRNRTPGQAT